MMGPITPGDWRVPEQLGRRERDGVGVIVVSTARGGDLLIADCRNRFLPLAEQKANARLIAEAARMRDAIRRIERAVGDLPAGKETGLVYAAITEAMKRSGIAADLTEEEPE